MNGLIPSEKIEKRIFLLRGQKVMLDADLAELYGAQQIVLFSEYRLCHAESPWFAPGF